MFNSISQLFYPLQNVKIICYELKSKQEWLNDIFLKDWIMEVLSDAIKCVSIVAATYEGNINAIHNNNNNNGYL